MGIWRTDVNTAEMYRELHKRDRVLKEKLNNIIETQDHLSETLFGELISEFTRYVNLEIAITSIELAMKD